ncbi:BPTI/Kunitz domain-containing protein [Melanotaenia boesemani]|uniref:BPTI/Kunitz domain-containing protein n=1 Tax=Melanotaenia boesemani TaxID=1250792 RepID=UPI001C04BC04|nr:BPTI/Kunitz domain-containing protein [Melanotaenia boesemani]
MKNLLLLGIFFSAFHISHSVTPEFCKLPFDVGRGGNFQFSVYYDVTSDTCNPFFYQGEGGNANRFASDIECMRNCSDRAEEIYPMDASKACHLKHDKGGCNGNILKFYYDPVYDKCKIFIWTGCSGNGNRFPDYQTCNTTCDGIHDDGDEPEEVESDTPYAIIFGVLLAIILTAVLITVIVLTVKSKKKSTKKKAKGKSNEPQPDSPLQERAIEMT